MVVARLRVAQLVGRPLGAALGADHYSLHLSGSDHVQQPFLVTEHGMSLDATAPAAGIVVGEPHHPVARREPPEQLPQDDLAALVCAVDDQPLAVSPGAIDQLAEQPQRHAGRHEG